MINFKQDTDILIDTTSENVVELLTSALFIETDLIVNIDTFSDTGFNCEGEGLIVTFIDGRKYKVYIQEGVNR